jgi:addiction module RelE/StbE family toxin
MIRIGFAPQFTRKFKALDSELQIEVKEKVELFKNPANHTQLKVHKLHGKLKNCCSFSVNYKIRVVFQYEDKKTITCLNLGDHEIYK